eukprot:jgi/Mesen1/10793/ME000092S10277
MLARIATPLANSELFLQALSSERFCVASIGQKSKGGAAKCFFSTSLRSVTARRNTSSVGSSPRFNLRIKSDNVPHRPSLARAFQSLFGQKEKPQMDRWWSPDTVAVVTGANKGIGFYIARRLAQEGLTAVLAARNPSLGQEALAKLQGEGFKNVAFRQLDITDKDSIDAFARWLEEQYGGLDILVNNAGFAFKGNAFGASEARQTIGVNYGGTRAVCERLLPLLRASPAGARVVNVCSSAGKLRIVSPELQRRFSDPDLTEEGLDALVDEFVSAVERGDHRQRGWPSSMYGVSKLAEAAYTRILDRHLSSRPDGQKVLVNACHPGYCVTDMTGGGGTISADDGAKTPVFLALAAPKSGAFFTNCQEENF